MARIISVADTFDRMISDSPYQMRIEIPMAVVNLVKLAGSKPDPDVVEALHSAYTRGVLGYFGPRCAASAHVMREADAGSC